MLDGNREIYAIMSDDTDCAFPMERVDEYTIDNWDFFKKKFKEKTYEQAVSDYIDFINIDFYFQTPTWYDSGNRSNVTKKLLKQLIKKQYEALNSARELLYFKDLLIELKEREIDDYKRITRNFYIISSVFALGFLLFLLYTSLLK